MRQTSRSWQIRAITHATQNKTRERVEVERDLATQCDLATLNAPFSGVAQQLAIHTTGRVATEAQAPMIVVHEGAQVTADAVNDKNRGAVSSVTLALKTNKLMWTER